MTSGKQSKRRRQAQEGAPPPVGRKGARRRASPKILAAAAAILVLVGVGVGLGVVFTGGSPPADIPQRGSLANALPAATEVQRILQRIPQRERVLGDPSAPVTMVEYVDLQCPYCQQFVTQVIPDLVTRYVRPGQLKIEARPIAFIGPDSERGRSLVLAAGRQNRLFNVMDLLYYNQGAENSGWLNDEVAQAAAASIPGLQVPALLAARGSSAVKEESQRLDALAQSDNVRGTPTILVGRSGGALREVQLTSATDPQPVQAAIEDALR